MACPECEAIQKQYLDLRRSVLLFARTLNRFEGKRLATVDENRPDRVPSMRELRALIENEAGLALGDPPAIWPGHG